MKKAHKTLRIGVSSCLLGNPVRYDGKDKRDPCVVSLLADQFELVPICPEVGIGMGVPRPPMRLVGDPHCPRARGIANPELDYTDQLMAYAKHILREHGDLCGYVFKARSPSCGLVAVDVYDQRGAIVGSGQGVFAAAIVSSGIDFPMVEESQLSDASTRELFIARARAYGAR
jgi:uncharacterized protein YbbK (DUF523 family)